MHARFSYYWAAAATLVQVRVHSVGRRRKSVGVERNRVELRVQSQKGGTALAAAEIACLACCRRCAVNAK